MTIATADIEIESAAVARLARLPSGRVVNVIGFTPDNRFMFWNTKELEGIIPTNRIELIN